jgi:hypothetical protein
LKSGEGGDRAEQSATMRAPAGPRGGFRVAVWRRTRARGPLGQGVARAPAAEQGDGTALARGRRAALNRRRPARFATKGTRNSPWYDAQGETLWMDGRPTAGAAGRRTRGTGVGGGWGVRDV